MTSVMFWWLPHHWKDFKIWNFVGCFLFWYMLQPAYKTASSWRIWSNLTSNLSLKTRQISAPCSSIENRMIWNLVGWYSNCRRSIFFRNPKSQLVRDRQSHRIFEGDTWTNWNPSHRCQTTVPRSRPWYLHCFLLNIYSTIVQNHCARRCLSERNSLLDSL